MGFATLAFCALWAVDSLLTGASLKLGNILDAASSDASEALAPQPVNSAVNASVHERPSVLVVVFSRRNAFSRRALVRDLWLRASVTTMTKVRFAICHAGDEHKNRLKEEHMFHGDLTFLKCPEGYAQGALTKKAAAALDYFYNKHPTKDFFMKVDDDSFVSWTRLYPLLATHGNSMSYMGVPIGTRVPCRNSSYRWYEPFETFNETLFPNAFAGGPGYILGRDLVHAIVKGGFHKKEVLYNEDRAMGVWVDRVHQTGRLVSYNDISGVDGGWGWDTKSPVRNWYAWKDYPFVVHHGLYAETIACLSVVERRKDPNHKLERCFAYEKEREFHTPTCWSQNQQARNETQNRAPVVASLLQTQREYFDTAAWATRELVVRTRPSLRSVIKADASGIPIPAGNAIDWKTNQQPLIFIHIPKNSGTAIEQSGHAAGVWWPRKWLSFWHGISMSDGSQCEKYHVPPPLLKELKDSDANVFQDETFCVTRHPYERAVSEYKYMLSVKWGRSMSEMYQTGLFNKPECTADGLNNFVQMSMQRVQEGRKFIHDCHFIPQHEFVYGKDGTQWCKHVLKNENLTAEFNELMEKFRYPVRLQPDGEKINNSSGCTSVSVKDLSFKTMRMLDIVYQADFDLFNYSRHQQQVGFLHIPRNGGGSIVATATKWHSEFPGTSPALTERMQLPDSSWCDKRHVPMHFMEKTAAEAFSNTENFCVTRHPYDRIVSSYLSFVKLPDATLSKMLKSYGVSQDVLKNRCSAEALNSFVKKAVEVAEGGRPFALDCHLLPQNEYIWDVDGTQHCHVMLPFDKLRQEFGWFMESRGFPDLKLIGDTKHLNQSRQGALPGCEGLQANDLDQETRTAMARYYADDFALLNYTAW